jgi:organic radical activating enzyme
MLEVPALEYHVAHGCNLSCRQCSHYSDLKGAFGPMPTPEQAASEYENWRHRVSPKRFAVLGGEPTTNPRLAEHIAVARAAWPAAAMTLVTNGFFLSRHPDLPEVLVKSKCKLDISQHGQGVEYIRGFRLGVAVVDRWKTRHPSLRVHVRKSHRGWMIQYKNEDGHPRPFNSDPKAAYAVCMQKHCTQIFRGSLWKCPAVAYFGILDRLGGAGGNAEWRMFREYQPLPPSALDDEILRFFSEKEIPQCSLCPASRTPFRHPDPLAEAKEASARPRNQP